MAQNVEDPSMTLTQTRWLLVASLAVIVWLSSALVRVKNRRYAMFVGMCPDKVVPTLHDSRCLAKVETRTHWLWHLYFALTD
jgi:low temperature requirement protein LtrA